jgi:hypothetical protein
MSKMHQPRNPSLQRTPAQLAGNSHWTAPAALAVAYLLLLGIVGTDQHAMQWLLSFAACSNAGVAIWRRFHNA